MLLSTQEFLILNFLHWAATQDKVAKCEELGAYLAINYNQDDFVDRIWKDTQTLDEPGTTSCTLGVLKLLSRTHSSASTYIIWRLGMCETMWNCRSGHGPWCCWSVLDKSESSDTEEGGNTLHCWDAERKICKHSHWPCLHKTMLHSTYVAHNTATL